MSFWDGMELWQRMLFILACAMVAVLFWGFWKLLWRRIKYKKLQSVDLEKSQTQADLTENVIKPDEIPFGIRALEAGIEVEGVVVSRPTSPRPAQNHNSSNMTLVDARSSMGSLMSCAHAESSKHSLGPPSPGLVSSFNQQGLPQHPRSVYQPNPYAAISGSTIHMASHHSSPATTRAPSSENVPGLAEPSMVANVPRTRGPSSPPPACNNRVTAMIGSHRKSVEGQRIGQPNVYGPSRSPSPPDSSPLPSLSENHASDSPDSDSSGSTSEDDKRATSGYKRTSNPPTDEGSKDLSLMQTHRLSHAAEVGQLTRRTPGPTRQSTTSIQSFRPASTPPNGMIYTTPSSPVYPVDIGMQQSPEGIEAQHPHRRTLSTFEFNQNVELAKGLFQPQLAAQPRDENPSGAAEDTPTNSRPASIRSKKSAKKLVKKNRHSQSSEVDV